MPRLVCLSGKLAGKEFPVRDRMRVGRLDTCEVRVPDDDVSREHATLRRQGSRWVVQDLGSRNGTSVNGKRVKQSPLAPGDRIGIGDLVLRFVDEEGPGEGAAAAGDPSPEDVVEEEDASSDAASSSDAEIDASEASEEPGEEDEESEDEAPEEDAPDASEPGREAAKRPARAPRPGAAPADASRAGPSPAARGFAFEAHLAPRQREVLEAVLFAIVWVLALLCASAATQVVLRLVAV